MRLPLFSARGRRSRAGLPGASPGPTRPAAALLVLALLLLVLPACSGGGPGGPGGFQMPPSPVEVASAEPQTVRDQFRALGSIDSDELIEIVAELNASVTSLPFGEGQAVAEGALIARLDDAEIKAQATRAEAMRDRAASEHDRAKQLFASNVISSKELEDAGTALRIAEADLDVAKARLEKTRIRAPFAGLAGRRRISAGAFVRTGDLITELARVDVMRVTFAAPERFVGRLKPGIPVQIETPAYPGRVFEGRLKVVDPIVDPRTRTVQLVASVPNRDRKLRPGMSADVSVTLAERSKAIVVPDEAVFAEGNQSFVYRVNPDSTVARAPVQLGTRDAAIVEVLSGLEPGDVVVRAGHQKLYDGARVMPIPAGGMQGGPGGAPGGGAGTPAEDKAGEKKGDGA